MCTEQAYALRQEFEENRDLVSFRLLNKQASCKDVFHGVGFHPPGLSRLLPLQTDREDIRKVVEHGEELLARFRHWEPLISECFGDIPCSPSAGPDN